MNYAQAIESRVTRRQAVAEIEAHGITVDVEADGTIRDRWDNEVIDVPGDDGMYRGSIILEYLGY